MFSKLLGTEDLITSFDGFGVFRPTVKMNVKEKSGKLANWKTKVKKFHYNKL